MNAYELFREFDRCVSDACEFLSISHEEFFKLSDDWNEHLKKFVLFQSPTDYYLAFNGDMGRSNICANILNQFVVFDILVRSSDLPSKRDGRERFVFADVGCGTAAVSFIHLGQYDQAYLIDVKNLAQDFVSWRCNKRKQSHVTVGDIDVLKEDVDVLVCIDVLEHIAESSKLFLKINERIRRGGWLLLRAPWASVLPQREHLPEAEQNFYNEGGARCLIEHYDLVDGFEFGGLYRKKETPAP
jgi:SAM-dependent methyltransferase